ncbi:MAG: hypothetical protein P1P84_01965 [Deferrisomatales bacterium]|nr:hypothetical protein [Deferrisomatales bacterium]
MMKMVRRRVRRTLRPFWFPLGYAIVLAGALALFLGSMQSCSQEAAPTTDRGVEIRVDNR